MSILASPEENTKRHYGLQDLEPVVLAALIAAGKDVDNLRPEDLAPIDEFHVRGRHATLELAAQVGLTAGDKVLDVGSGVGGPARFLALECGCQVTGLDLSHEYCRLAQSLADRMGLSDRVNFRQGSATEMPFDDDAFDVVWTMHASMNIPDKVRLFAEIARVLRPGGRLALYDVLAGPVAPVRYPVPWARDPSASFLIAPHELRDLLAGADFTVLNWRDTSELGRVWFTRVSARMERPGATPSLGLHLLLGPDFRTMAQNQVLNLNEDRIVLIECVARLDKLVALTS